MLRRPTDELVIKPRLSRAWRAGLGVTAVLIVTALSFAGYWGGREAVYGQLDSRARDIDALESQLRENRDLRRGLVARLDATRAELAATREQLEETKSSLTQVTRQLQIDKSAYKQLRKELETSTIQITELGNELKFYRSIISPADGRSGVRIQDFQVQPADVEDEYRYRLILIQALEHEEDVKGIVRFEISGTEGGVEKTIHAPSESGQRISAEFKYFQNFAGTFRLPAGFMPAEITVVFEAEDEAVVQRMYPWPDHVDPRNA